MVETGRADTDFYLRSGWLAIVKQEIWRPTGTGRELRGRGRALARWSRSVALDSVLIAMGSVTEPRFPSKFEEPARDGVANGLLGDRVDGSARGGSVRAEPFRERGEPWPDRRRRGRDSFAFDGDDLSVVDDAVDEGSGAKPSCFGDFHRRRVSPVQSTSLPGRVGSSSVSSWMRWVPLMACAGRTPPCLRVR